MSPEKLIGPSQHPHSSDSLMREARRMLRAAGAYRLHDAEDYVLYAGQKAYELMADWLGEDEPTINLTPLKYGSSLRPWELLVEHVRR